MPQVQPFKKRAYLVFTTVWVTCFCLYVARPWFRPPFVSALCFLRCCLLASIMFFLHCLLSLNYWAKVYNSCKCWKWILCLPWHLPQPFPPLPHILFFRPEWCSSRSGYKAGGRGPWVPWAQGDGGGAGGLNRFSALLRLGQEVTFPRWSRFWDPQHSVLCALALLRTFL